MYPKLSVKLYGKGVVLDGPVDGSILKMQRHQIALVGQVILSEIWGKKGAIGFVPEGGEAALCTSHFFFFDVNSASVDPGWLQAIFRADYLADQLGSNAFGTTGYAAARPKTLLAATIPLPPLKEQQRIVGRIDSLVSKIEEVSALRHRVSIELTALTASLHFALSKGRRVRLDRLVVLEENRVSVCPAEFYPQIGIRGFGGGMFAKPPLSGSETQYRHFNRLKKGDLVLSQVKGWEGAIAVCTREFEGYYASPEYRTFRCIEETCDPEYLDVLVRSCWFQTLLQSATHGQGARRERTRPEQFVELVLSMPEIEDQKKAIRILRSLKGIDAFTPQLTESTKSLLSSILDSAFKGAL